MTLINNYKISALLDYLQNDPQLQINSRPFSYESIIKVLDKSLQQVSTYDVVINVNNKTYYRIYWDCNASYYTAPLRDGTKFEIHFLDNCYSLDDLTYVCTYDTNTRIISDVSPEAYFNRAVNKVKLIEGLSISLPNIVVNEEIYSNMSAYITDVNSSNILLRTSFTHDMIWDNLLYPVYIFDYSGINLSLLSFNSGYSFTQFPPLPKPIATKTNQFINLPNVKSPSYPYCLYLGGDTKYIEDELILNDLRRIIYQYLYENSHITSNYTHLAITISHYQEDIPNTTRLIITKIREGDKGIRSDSTLMSLLLFNKTVKGLKVTNSKATSGLTLNIEKWLDHYKLFTFELTTSFYIVKIDADAMFKNFEYISSTPLPSYLN